MNTDVEDLVRHVFTDSNVPASELDPHEVVAIGRRVRRIRRRRATLAGIAATGVVAFGAAQVIVPATGTPLTPIVWASGEGSPGTEAGAWVMGNGHRFVISIRDAYFGDRNAYVLSALNADGSERVLMAGGPLRPQDMPEVGFAVSTEPGVQFAIFPVGAHDFAATTQNGSDVASISTMKISSPHGGPDYVAVALDSGGPGQTVTHVTWLDEQGEPQSWGNPQ